MPAIHLSGDPYGWTTNQRPRSGPLRSACRLLWTGLPPIHGEVHQTAQFVFPRGRGHPPDTDSVSWAAKVSLDAAVDSGLIRDDTFKTVASVLLVRPILLVAGEEGAGLFVTLGPIPGLSTTIDRVGRLPTSDKGRRVPRKHGTEHAYRKRGCRCKECEDGHKRRLKQRQEQKWRRQERRRQERLATGTHGTGQMVADGCSCEVCEGYVRSGKSSYLEQRRYSAMARLRAGELAHGTSSAYNLARCRCEKCWSYYKAKHPGKGP